MVLCFLALLYVSHIAAVQQTEMRITRCVWDVNVTDRFTWNHWRERDWEQTVWVQWNRL